MDQDLEGKKWIHELNHDIFILNILYNDYIILSREEYYKIRISLETHGPRIGRDQDQGNWRFKWTIWSLLLRGSWSWSGRLAYNGEWAPWPGFSDQDAFPNQDHPRSGQPRIRIFKSGFYYDYYFIIRIFVPDQDFQSRAVPNQNFLRDFFPRSGFSEHGRPRPGFSYHDRPRSGFSSQSWFSDQARSQLRISDQDHFRAVPDQDFHPSYHFLIRIILLTAQDTHAHTYKALLFIT